MRRRPGPKSPQPIEATLESLKLSIPEAATPAYPSPAPSLGSSSSIRYVWSWRRSPRSRFAIRNLKPTRGRHELSSSVVAVRRYSRCGPCQFWLRVSTELSDATHHDDCRIRGGWAVGYDRADFSRADEYLARGASCYRECDWRIRQYRCCPSRARGARRLHAQFRRLEHACGQWRNLHASL